MNINTILVVDDHEGDQLLNQIIIENFDPSIKVLQAYDGKEALETLSTCHPDIIFLDINMPGMNGHQFLENYNNRGNHSHVVVMLTSSNQTIDKERTQAYPFVKKYIEKPLTIDDLKDIENILYES